MRADVRFHQAAEDEYNAAFAWYMEHGLDVAAAFESEVEHGLELVADAPERWPVCDEDCHRLILNRFPYSIVYFVDHVVVWIVAVAHHRREPDYWVERLD